MGPPEALRIRCPYCGEAFWIAVDCSLEAQQYVEDCRVCCKPIELSLHCAPGEPPRVIARRDDDA